MAKQTYTTGQVLTAAQMTTLQANDYNQTVSAKVASYTLVAADAGTRITMSNASATTITVNTGLFAAGDTLYITNIGAGVSTITAGTATVSTASSLALGQYDSGVLYFTSTGVALWEKYDGAAASGGGMTQIATGTLSGSSVSITSIPATYVNLYLQINNPYITTGTALFQMTFNSDTTASSYSIFNGASAADDASVFRLLVGAATLAATSTDYTGFGMHFDNYTSTNATKVGRYTWANLVRGDRSGFNFSWSAGNTTAISSLQIKTSASTFAGGTYTLGS